MGNTSFTSSWTVAKWRAIATGWDANLGWRETKVGGAGATKVEDEPDSRSWRWRVGEREYPAVTVDGAKGSLVVTIISSLPATTTTLN